MTLKVIDRDFGFKDLLGALDDLKGEISVLVGVPEASKEYKDGANQVLIASVQEFGSSDGRIPERSFLRSTVDEKSSEYSALLTKLVGRVVDGKITPNQALDRLGLKVESDVKRKIVAIQEPPNAASTIRQKKKKAGKKVKNIKLVTGADGTESETGNPLIDTGQLRQSITYEIRREKKS